MDELDEQGFSIQELREGSPQAFKQLFFKQYSEFYAFAYALLEDKISARNSTTDAFFLFWKKREYFDNYKDSKAFLYNTIRNSCFNYLKYLQKHPDTKEYFPEFKIETAFPEDILKELLAYAASVA